MNDYGVDDLGAFLREHWVAFAAAHGLPKDGLVLPELHPDEAGLLAAAVYGPRTVVRMGPGATFQPVGLDDGSKKSTYTLFTEPRTLNRQYLMQVVALHRLTDIYDWMTRSLRFETDGYDVQVRHERKLAIAGIADKSAAGLASRVEAITAGFGDPVARTLRTLRPEVFWAIAPGRSEVFDVVEEDGGLVFQPRDDLPRRPT